MQRRQVEAIVRHAMASDVDTLDTAIGYGDSESTLGEIGVKDWKIVSKLPDVPKGCTDIEGWVAASIRESVSRLKVDSLYGVLLHRPDQLLEAEGDALYAALLQLKRDGIAGKIGVSVYDPARLDELVARYPMDLVQAPFNIFDRRLIESGWLKRLAAEETELHVRSVFLQGLLLMSSGDRPDQFARWQPLWTAYDDWVAESGLTRLQACLGWVLSFPEIAKVVVGVYNVDQLIEILYAAGGPAPLVPDSLGTSDRGLLDPFRWS